MKTIVQMFLEILYALVGCSIYVWGGNGEDLMQMTDAQRAAYFDKHERADSGRTKAENIALCEALFQKIKAKGHKTIRAFDCSGLIYYALKQLFPNQKDMAARHFYAACNPSSETGMSLSDLKEGDFVFKDKGFGIVHIGCYVGNNKVIECAGREKGVVKQSIGSAWNKFGEWPALFTDVPEPQPEPQPEPTPSQPVKGTFVVTKGNVYVRRGNGKYAADGKKNAQIGKHSVPKGTKLPYMGRAKEDPYWYQVEYLGEQGYISSNPRFTKLVEE